MRTIDAMVPEPAAIAFSAMRTHKRKIGVYPNLVRPKTFNEKVLYRIVFDRRPILTRLQDKYAAREYVRERVGENVLSRLYWVTRTPTDIPFDDLPDKFVVKATHGRDFTYLVPDKAHVNREDVVTKCVSWLSWNYYKETKEWAYKHIEPRIIVEEFVNDGTGLTPMDYKFYVFAGRVHMIQVDVDRFVDHRRDLYIRPWDRVNVTTRFKPIGGVPRPPHLDEMIECAEKLGYGLDFLRVDLYDADKVHFGELTLYPAAGAEIFRPDVWSRHLGDLWNLSIGRTASRPITAGDACGRTPESMRGFTGSGTA